MLYSITEHLFYVKRISQIAPAAPILQDTYQLPALRINKKATQF
jgi:hypothetical protein